MSKIDQLSRKELRHAIKRADLDILEDAIVFLEDDPRTFGSGYAKELIWKYIKRYNLSTEQVARLENAAIQYLFRPMSREFKYMCQTMAWIASDSFWDTVQPYLDSDNPRAQVNSYCLYRYSGGLIAGEKLRLQLDAIKYAVRWYVIRSQPDQIQVHPPITVEELLIRVEHESNWYNGKVIYREVRSDNPSIYYDFAKLDKEFACLDVEASNKNQLLKTFDLVLSTGFKIEQYYVTWLYTIYLLGQIKEVRAVEILKRFLKGKIEFEYGSYRNHLEMLVLKTLRKYGTSEAMEVVRRYKKRELIYSDYYGNKKGSWAYSYPAIDN